MWLYSVLPLDLHGHDADGTSSKHILPNGPEKWWFTMLQSKKKSPTQQILAIGIFLTPGKVIYFRTFV